jgi:hypothetical protein
MIGPDGSKAVASGTLVAEEGPDGDVSGLLIINQLEKR